MTAGPTYLLHAKRKHGATFTIISCEPAHNYVQFYSTSYAKVLLIILTWRVDILCVEIASVCPFETPALFSTTSSANFGGSVN